MGQDGSTPDRDAEKVTISTARTCKFLVEVIVYDAEVWLMSRISSLSPPHPSAACIKAASAHFTPRPNPLDALVVSADRSSSVRFGEVSPKPPVGSA